MGCDGKKRLEAILKHPIPFALLSAAILSTIVSAIGLAAMPYGYYTFLRLVLCASCGVGCFVAVQSRSQAWPWVYGVGCLLYNPVIPVHLGRGAKGTWILLNAAVVVLLWIGVCRFRSRPNNSVDAAEADGPEHVEGP